MEYFLELSSSGLVRGSIYALIALGYTMVYGIVELINFAHGDVFTLGGFLALTIVGALGAAAIIVQVVEWQTTVTQGLLFH